MKTRILVVLVTIMCLIASSAQAQDTTDSSSNVYLPLMARIVSIPLAAGQTHLTLRAKKVFIQSEWGIVVDELRTESSHCSFSDQTTELQVFCGTEEFRLVIHSDYLQTIRIVYQDPAYSDEFLDGAGAEEPEVVRFPFVSYTEDQKTSVLSAAFPIKIVNAGNKTQSFQVIFEFPLGSLQIGALPSGCHPDYDHPDRIVCFGVEVGANQVRNLLIPVTWNQTGTYEVKILVLEGIHSTRPGWMIRRVTVTNGVEAAADPSDPESLSWLVYAPDVNTTVSQFNSYHTVKLINMADTEVKVDVTANLPAGTNATAQNFCTVSGAVLSCKNVLIPPNSMILVRTEMHWSLAGSFHIETYAVTSEGGVLLRGGHLFPAMHVLQPQSLTQ